MITKAKEISLVLSVYNEESLIKSTIQRLVSYMNEAFVNNKWEIILVDDGSTDNTLESMKQATQSYSNVRIIQHRKCFGQGRGFRSAFAVATGDILVTLDADLSYDPIYIGKLIEEMERSNADIVIASAFLSGSHIKKVPLLRKIFTVCANRILSFTSSLDLSAITCAVRAYRTDVIQLLPVNSNGMEINLEIILKAQMMNLHVTEIPATLKWSSGKGRKRGRTNLSLLKSIFRYSFFSLLFSPNTLFLMPLVLTLSVFLIYSFSLLKIVFNRITYVAETSSLPLLESISEGLRWSFLNYTHAFYFLITSLIILFFLLTAWFISRQNKFYFEQTHALLHSLITANRNLSKKVKR